MDSTKRSLTNRCSVAYFKMYELLVKMSIIEDKDGDSLGDYFISIDADRRL
jgi:hypothetical protein